MGRGRSSGFLEMDAVFNPGARYFIESKQKERVQVRREEEMFEGPDSIADSVAASAKINVSKYTK